MDTLNMLVVTVDAETAQAVLESAAGLERVSATHVASVADAARAMEQSVVDLVVVDLATEDSCSGGNDGIDLLLAIRQNMPGVSVLAVTDRELRKHDREAIKLGVEGFLVKPVQREHVHFQLAHIREVRRLREQNLHLRSAVGQGGGFDRMVGLSREMKQVFHLVARAATSNAPVAIYGESGTGKEMIASAIHRHSPRHAGPLICVNPSAIPESLLESELFGHVRGAFTGASSDRIGYVEAAQGGTLFLDEIGDLPLSFQGRFLRVLQERVLHRIGATKRVPVDFRLITATSRDMQTEIRAGRFREDLFYRIHVFPIHLPPLRRRRGDIPLLAEHFLEKYAREMGRPVQGFAAGATELLLSYAWPGNVRELENVVHRLVAIKTDDTAVQASDLAGLLSSRPAGPAALPMPAADGTGPPRAIGPLEEHVREYVRWAFESLGRNKARTARVLGIDRATLYRKLRPSQ